MFRSLFALALIALVAPVSHAQDQWNRRISDVRIVHPPGTPPGTWRVESDVETFATDSAPSPTNLSYDVHIALNGVEIQLIPEYAELGTAAALCNFATCNGGACGPWANIPPYPPYPGNCRLFTFHSGLTLCGCIGIRRTTGGSSTSALRTTDTITVTLSDGAGSLPETDTSDDSFTITVDSNVIGTPVCAGDGTLPTPCPCGNNGSSGNGCANSANPAGASISATGWSQPDALTGDDTVVLHGSGMPATSTAIYLKGSAVAVGGQPFGDGVSCVGGSLIRLRTKINVGGASQFPEPGDPSLSNRGATPPGSGLTGVYAVYYRNAAAAFCPPFTYNISSTMQIDW